MKFMRYLIPFIILVLAIPALAKDVTMQWDPSPSPDLAHYKVYRAEWLTNRTSSNFTEIAIVPPNTTTYTDVGLNDNKYYIWYTSAVSTQGIESKASNITTDQDRIVPVPGTNLHLIASPVP